MAVSDNRLIQLTRLAARGEVLTQPDVTAVLRELLWWRARFAELVTESLKVKASADTCICELDARHERQLAALRRQNRELAQRAVILLPTLEYDHDPEV